MSIFKVGCYIDFNFIIGVNNSSTFEFYVKNKSFRIKLTK